MIFEMRSEFFRPMLVQFSPAVGGFVDAIADRNAVARPCFAGAHPNSFRSLRIDGDRADRLHGLLVEHGLERRAAIHDFQTPPLAAPT